jgi:hypothetical protein
VSSGNNGEVDIAPDYGPAYTPVAFTQSSTGSVALSALATTTETDEAGTVSVTGVRSVRAAWIVADQTDANVQLTQKVDVQSYSGSSTPGSVLGAIAWADKDRLLALTGEPLSDGGMVTNVQMATRATTTPSVEPGRFTLAEEPSHYVVAGSNGFGYVFFVDTDSKGTSTPTVEVFAAGCK